MRNTASRLNEDFAMASSKLVRSRGGYEEEESIYNIIPVEVRVPTPQPRHKSCHNPLLPPTASMFALSSTTRPGIRNLAGEVETEVGNQHRFIRQKATLGAAPGTSKPSPQDALLKNTGAKPVMSLSEVKKVSPELLQPSVLRPKLKAATYYRSDSKQEIEPKSRSLSPNRTRSALATVLRPKIQNKVVEETGLKKKDYGKVPAYLEKIKRRLDDEEECARRAKAKGGSPIRLLSEDQHQALVTGLKDKWFELNQQYQVITHKTMWSTLGEIRKKEYFETALSQIEKDLEKLNKKYILVDDSV